MFVRSEHANGAPPERILAALNAIEAIHADNNLASPTATKSVRTELSRVLKVEAPRWNNQEKLIFYGLPPEAQEIISRHSRLDSKAVRKAQNEAAELRHQIKQL
jgi:DNA polymerase III delta subunit